MGLEFYISINFAPMIGLGFLIFFLRLNRAMDRRIRHLFFLLIVFEFTELAAYSLELECATMYAPTIWRVILSIIGYTLRPLLCYLILKIELRKRETKQVEIALLIPLLLNMLVNLTALWSGVAFSYTADNQFVRGPLSYVTVIVLIFYMLVIIAEVVRSSKDRVKIEIGVIAGLAVLVLFSVFVEMFFDIRSLGRTTIVMVTVFYYLFFQTEEYRESIEKGEQMVTNLAARARLDNLTGLVNKTAFLEETERILAAGTCQSVALIFFDLDHFKEVNDTMGHIMGDTVLKDIADKLRKVFRSSDLVGRFGGDEYYVLLTDIGMADLKKRLKIANKELNMIYNVEDKYVRITASIGASYVERVSERSAIDSMSMLRVADEAVYEAKKDGRNQYHIITI